MEVAIATMTGIPPEFTDDARLADAVGELGVAAELIPWDDPRTDWRRFDAVVIRSTWDYARRRDEFLAWAGSVGGRLHNPPDLVRWNSDKRYLADFAAAGFPVVPTSFVAPAQPTPDLDGEVVVKPNVSAGGRDSGRFGPGAHRAARELIAAIQASGRSAMVQPFQPSVDSVGETAVLCIDGEPLHALRKRAVLRPDEVAPVREDEVGAAEAMYDPSLVTPTEATAAERALARAIVAELGERFGSLPLYARVDLIPGAGGEPLLLELEAVEPNFYLGQVPGSVAPIAAAIAERANQSTLSAAS
jgi:glutathione synthase/RimK-type ligase-like ATP-grasp enzyme